MSASASASAYGLGVAHVSTLGDGSKVLDTYYPWFERAPVPAPIAEAGGADGAGTFVLDDAALGRLTGLGISELAAAARAAAGMVVAPVTGPARRVAVLCAIADLDAAPADTHDVYLRLHLLSGRLVRPHGCNLDGMFGLLQNVVWTDAGPFDPDGFEAARAERRSRGERITVLSVDKFPQMVDYVLPAGVRIAAPSRVRLGAYLGDGTTVMHEGFVNFNAGTEGPAMVEGRISAGVFVGADSDIGGGASIMGTLSGGGKEVVSVGSHCLIGANGGIGISLGDNCVVEAGLYVTAGTLVALPDGTVCKAAQLSGRSDMLFRRNSRTGAVEMLPQSAEWGGLNTDLHAND